MRWQTIQHIVYSALAPSKTASNVKDLKLEWVWSIPEGASEPASIGINGSCICITTTFKGGGANIIQALDAALAELI